MRRRVIAGAAGVLALIVAAAGVAVLTTTGGFGGPPPLPVEDVAGERVDLYGDPLPPGAVARLGTSRFRSGSDAIGLAYTRDGKQIRSAFAFDRVAWFEVESGRVERVVQGSCGWFEYPGPGPGLLQRVKLALTGGQGPDRWRRDELTAVLSVSGTDDFVTAGRTIRCWSSAGDARTVASGIWIPRRLITSPDGRTIVRADVQKQSLRAVDLATGAEHDLCAGPTIGITDVACTFDGQRVFVLRADRHAGFENLLYSVALDGSPGVRDIATVPWPAEIHAAPDGSVWVSSFSDGLMAFSGDDGSELPRVDLPNRWSSAVAFTDQGVAAVLRDSPSGSDLGLYHVATRKLLRSRRIEELRSVREIAFSSDGTELALASESGAIDRIDVASLRRLTPDRGHLQGIVALTISPDATRVTTASAYGCRTWELGSGRPVSSFSVAAEAMLGRIAYLHTAADRADVRVCGMQFGSHLVCADVSVRDGFVHAINSVPLQSEESSLRVAERSLCASVEAERVGLLLSDGTGRPGSKSVPVRRVVDAATGSTLFESAASCDDFRLGCMAISPDGRYVAWQDSQGEAGSGPGIVSVKSLDDDAQPVRLRVAPKPPASAASFSPDDSRIAVMGGTEWLRVIDRETGDSLWERGLDDLDAHPFLESPVLAWSPDGSILVASDFDDTGRAFLFRAADGELLATAAGHRGNITAMEFTRDGRYLVTASSDTTALVWDVAELLGR